MTGEQREKWREMLAGDPIVKAAMEETDALRPVAVTPPPADMSPTLAAYVLGRERGYLEYAMNLRDVARFKTFPEALESNYGWREKQEKVKRHG